MEHNQNQSMMLSQTHSLSHHKFKKKSVEGSIALNARREKEKSIQKQYKVKTPTMEESINLVISDQPFANDKYLNNNAEEDLYQMDQLKSLRSSKEEWTYGIWWFCIISTLLIVSCFYFVHIGYINIMIYIAPLTIFCNGLNILMCHLDFKYSKKIKDQIEQINAYRNEQEKLEKYDVKDRCCCCNYKIFKSTSV